MPKRKASDSDTRINAAYARRCSGVQINLMDIPKVFRVGQEAIDRGCTDEELGDRLAAYVESIRTN